MEGKEFHASQPVSIYRDFTHHALRFTFILFLMGTIATGCQSRNNSLPRIRYGEESCDRCRMIISEKRFAVAYRTESGDLRKFDDIGCAVLHREEGKETVKQFWGYDYKETTWLDAREAFFVHSPNLTTPMGYGIVALPTKEQAIGLAKKVNGQVLQFDQFQQVLKPQNRNDNQ